MGRLEFGLAPFRQHNMEPWRESKLWINNMRTQQWNSRKWRTLIGTAAALLSAMSTWAAPDPSDTFRALAYGVGVYQGANGAGKPVYAYQPLAGHDLVAAALGVPLGTVLTNQVFAMQIDCASSTASLVVFDKTSSNTIATIAVSTSLDVVQQQDRDLAAFPNRERFVAQFAVTPTNHLVGGFLTLAGRLQLNPTNGCPRAIRIDFDPKDRICADSATGANLDDRPDRDILRAGVGHAAGAVDLIFNDGTTNTVLLPYVGFSIRHELK